MKIALILLVLVAAVLVVHNTGLRGAVIDGVSGLLSRVGLSGVSTLLQKLK